MTASPTAAGVRRRRLELGRWDRLLVILAGASAVMLVPRLFGDPLSVDPDAWRLTAYFAAVTAGAAALPRLRSSLPLDLALLGMALPYSASMWLLGYDGPLGGLLGPAYGLARNVWSGLAWALLAVLVAIVYHRLCPDAGMRILTRPGWTALGLGLGGSLLFLAVAFLLPGPLIGREGVPLLSLSGGAGLSYGIANATSAIGQEIQFRGVLLSALEREQPARVAVLTQAAIFSLAHVVVAGPAADLIPVVLVLGLLWGWMTQRSGSLWPAALGHVVADLFLLTALVSGLYGG